MRDFLMTNSTKLKDHKRLVKLISDESERLDLIKKTEEKDRCRTIIEFLVELQCLTSRKLKKEIKTP